MYCDCTLKLPHTIYARIGGLRGDSWLGGAGGDMHSDDRGYVEEWNVPKLRVGG